MILEHAAILKTFGELYKIYNRNALQCQAQIAINQSIYCEKKENIFCNEMF